VGGEEQEVAQRQRLKQKLNEILRKPLAVARFQSKLRKFFIMS
jgi:hypothetical protein